MISLSKKIYSRLHHPVVVDAEDKIQIKTVKKELQQVFKDARENGCELYVDLDLHNFHKQKCSHIWCAGYDRSAAYDLIQLARGINSQRSKDACDCYRINIAIENSNSLPKCNNSVHELYLKELYG